MDDDTISEPQYGLKADECTTDAIFALEVLAEMYREVQKVHVCDRVPRKRYRSAWDRRKWNTSKRMSVYSDPLLHFPFADGCCEGGHAGTRSGLSERITSVWPQFVENPLWHRMIGKPKEDDVNSYTTVYLDQFPFTKKLFLYLCEISSILYA